MSMLGLQSLKASDSIAENMMLNSVGARTQPCLTVSVGHLKDFRHVASGCHCVVEMADDCKKLAGAAIFSHNFPVCFMADRVEGLGEVSKGCVEVAVFLYIFLSKLASCEYHDDSPSTCAKAALALRKEALFHVFQKAVDKREIIGGRRRTDDFFFACRCVNLLRPGTLEGVVPCELPHIDWSRLVS